MSDLDSNGNVDYSGSSSYKSKSNYLDVKREFRSDIIGTDNTSISVSIPTKTFTIGGGDQPWFEFVGVHTVKEITGISRATEGVNIKLRHGLTNELLTTIWVNNIAVGITSGTGDALTYPTDNLFYINGDTDPITNGSPEIFIPVQDLSRVVIAPLPNGNTIYEGIIASLQTTVQIKIT